MPGIPFVLHYSTEGTSQIAGENWENWAFLVCRNNRTSFTISPSKT
jgi:hypothetical protein